ncbi:hypothetical protein DIPPA_18561 [Diplonema papillatum]|nr:hypothetical protein DIPPA_18561 [Diplonema papillatum]
MLQRARRPASQGLVAFCGGLQLGTNRRGAVQQVRWCSQAPEAKKLPLTDDQLSQLVAQAAPRTQPGANPAAVALEVDEINSVAQPVVNCLQSQVGLSATEMLVMRAEANPHKTLTFEQLRAFNRVIRDQHQKVGADDTVLVQALWETFAPHSAAMPAGSLPSFVNILWLGKPPKEAVEYALSNATPTLRDFLQFLEAKGLGLPTFRASEGSLRSKTNWAGRVILVIVGSLYMFGNSSGLLDRLISTSPLGGR